MSRRRSAASSHFLPFHRTLYLSTLPLLLVSLSLPKLIRTDGNVGCLYSNVCDGLTERCFDDSTLGRCVYKFTTNDDDFTRYELDYEDLEKLKEQLQQLQKLGYNLKHSHTQCIMQTQLNAIKFGLPFDGSICERMETKREAADPVRELQYRQALSDMRRHNEFVIPKRRHSAVLENEGVIKYVPEDDEDILETLDATNSFGTRFADEAIVPRTDAGNELIDELQEQSSNTRGKIPIVYKKSAKFTSSRYRGTPLYVPLRNRGKFKSNHDDVEEEDENEDDNWSAPLSAETIADISEDISASQKSIEPPENNMKAYTEGGPIYFSDNKPDYGTNSVYEKLFDQYDNDFLGFQRSERLDVKKPGPNYKVNNYAFGNVNTKTDQNEDKYKNEEDEFIKRRAIIDYNDRYMKEMPVSEYEYVPSYGPSFRTDNSAYITIETDKKTANVGCEHYYWNIDSI